jgi:hypothetical protein
VKGLLARCGFFDNDVVDAGALEGGDGLGRRRLMTGPQRAHRNVNLTKSSSTLLVKGLLVRCGFLDNDVVDAGALEGGGGQGGGG